MSVYSSAGSSSLGSPETKRHDADITTITAPTLQRDIFGSDSESGDDTPKHSPQKRTVASLSGSSDDEFQDAVQPTQNITAHDILGSSSGDGSDSESDTASSKAHSQGTSSPTTGIKPDQESDANEVDNDEEVRREVSDDDGAGEQFPEEPDEIRIAADFPLIRADLGKEMHLVKMPNFLSVETRPFDPAFYEGELDEDEVLDEEGRTRLKLKVENTIRWRFGKNESGEDIHESNARIVRWSDGSLSLHLGDEIFDVHKMDIQSDFNHLFIREDRGLQGQSVFKTKLTFRPHSTDSFTHRKITLSLADKTNKSQKVKILAVAGADPESNRNVLVKKEEEKLRASLRRETQQRRMQERQLASAAHRTKRSTARSSTVFGDDEGDSDLESLDDGPNDISLAALKRDAKTGKSSRLSRRQELSDSDSMDGSVSDVSEKPVRKKARISDEDENDLSN